MKKTMFLLLLLAVTTFTQAKPPMLKMDFDLQVGKANLKAVESIVIDGSSDLLSDTATITLPGMVQGKALKLEDAIKRGDRVTIRLGYDSQLIEEFTGYLRTIAPNNPLKLECEDEIFLFRKPIKDKLFNGANLMDILSYVVGEVNKQGEEKFKLVTDITGLKYDKLVLHRTTGYEALESLKQETGLAIFCRGYELHAHLAYEDKTGEVKYDFERNVERSDQLQYVKKEDVKVLVKVIGKTKDNASVEVQAGTAGGDQRTFRLPNISDKATLEVFAKQQLSKLSYDGYRGGLLAWLTPYVNYGYTAKLADKEYPEREGNYYVNSVKTEFSASTGGKRTVGLGFRLG